MPISRRVKPNVLGRDSGLHLAGALSSSLLSAHLFHLFFVSVFRTCPSLCFHLFIALSASNSLFSFFLFRLNPSVP